MIKLISLEGFLSLSADAVGKIETALKASGLEKKEKYDDADDFIDAVIENIDEGTTVVLAAENEEYNSVKQQLIDTFGLRSGESEEVKNAVIKSGNNLSNVHDLDGHLAMPLDGDIYVSEDGLYSGFCVEFSNGARMILVPLDTSRLDGILIGVREELAPGTVSQQEKDDFEKAALEAAALKAAQTAAESDEPEYNDAAAFDELDDEIELEEDDEPEVEEEIVEEEPEDEEIVEEVPEDEEVIDEEEEQDDEIPEEYSEKILEDEPTQEEPETEPEAEAESEEDMESEADGTIFAADEFSGEPDEDDEEMTLTLKSGVELVVDDSEEDEEEKADLTGFGEAIKAAGKTAHTLLNLDKTVAFVTSPTSPYLAAMFDEVEGLSDTFSVCDETLDNDEELEVQVALAKKTRLAIKDTGAQFGAAVSPIRKEEKDGKEIYYSYIVIHDGASAKAKKVSTSTKQGIESLIPHAFAVMFDLIGRKAESMAQLESDEALDDGSDKKKKTIILALSIVLAVIAILCAVLMVWKYFQKTPEEFTTTDPASSSSTPVSDTQQFSLPSTSAPSTTLGDPGMITTDPQYPYPTEPTAGDVSNIPTSTPFASTKGTFTFTVYGYGHGVGMSQTGANYYAGLGKSYLEILAIYYYGATLVLGDEAPETVKYANTEYTLRDYLATVVQSEMGESFAPEALKAQAVAAYTFAKYYNFDVPETLHAFSKKPSQAVYDAVDVVKGQYMVYNGEVIKAYFHATSAGKTTSYTNTFGDAQIPYLSGGRPSYGDINAKDYCTTVTYTSDELNELIYSKTGKKLEGDPANWIKILSHDGCINDTTGYVSKIQVGDQVYSGNDFRLKVLGGAIRSHCFTFIYSPTG